MDKKYYYCEKCGKTEIIEESDTDGWIKENQWHILKRKHGKTCGFGSVLDGDKIVFCLCDYCLCEFTASFVTYDLPEIHCDTWGTVIDDNVIDDSAIGDVIDNEVTIGDYLFNIETGTIVNYFGCEKSLTIPEYINGILVKNIGEAAFAYRFSLSEVFIPDGVTTIENNAFLGCSQLRSITIPKNVRYILNFAFEDCCRLSSITFKGYAPTIGYNIFRNVDSNFKIYFDYDAKGFTEPTWMGYECERELPF